MSHWDGPSSSPGSNQQGSHGPPDGESSLHPQLAATGSGSDDFLAGFLRLFQSNREAQEAERKRRLEWEASVESRHNVRAAEMDIRLTSMQQQIDTLKRALEQQGAILPLGLVGAVAAPPAGLMSNSSPATSINRHMAVAPQLQVPAVTSYSAFPTMSSVLGKRQRDGDDADAREVNLALTGDPHSSRFSEADLSLSARKKKDSRPVTIQTAMRTHIARLMGLDSDKSLPHTYNEAEPFPEGSPVRFVWEKTPKQSAHNGRMKQQIINDLMQSRVLYPFVPENDFTPHVLDRTFDQAFTTLRQKYRVQAGLTAPTEEERLEQKVKRTRRANRKKAKLQHRIASRSKGQEWQDPMYEKALDLAMMSSESSDEGDEDLAPGAGDEKKVFRIHPLAWRSAKARRFFSALDAADETEKSSRPRRGVGRRERRVGVPKEGEEGLPPKGTPVWMLSRKFLRETPREVLDKLGIDGLVNWDALGDLGYESDSEE